MFLNELRPKVDEIEASTDAENSPPFLNSAGKYGSATPSSEISQSSSHKRGFQQTQECSILVGRQQSAIVHEA